MIYACPQTVRKTSANGQRRPTLPNGVLAAQTGCKGHHPRSAIRAVRIRLTDQLVRSAPRHQRQGSWALALNRGNVLAGAQCFSALPDV
jgi:hypothetical protein